MAFPFRINERCFRVSLVHKPVTVYCLNCTISNGWNKIVIELRALQFCLKSYF